MQQENPIIVGLDIGTTKIAAIAGRKNQYGKLEILGFGRADSSGVNHGMVLNIEECIDSINTAVINCIESNPNLDIKDVYVGIAGFHIKSLQTKGERVISNSDEEVRKEDVDALINDQLKTFIPNNDKIIDIIPQDFTIDLHKGFSLDEIIGMTGVRLGANFHIITGEKNAIRNIHRCVERANLFTKELVLQPLASAAAVMCADDLEAGVAIVDIGGGTTDLAIFHEGMLKHTVVIPIAGVDITNDIRQGLGVLRAQAEAMKTKFGVALAEEAQSNVFITIPGLKGQPQKEISIKNLAHIIQSRMEEILDYVVYHIKQLNLEDKLHGGIILTGGGSQLKHLVQLTEYKTGMPTRIGLPNEHLSKGHLQELMKPMYATCIGLVLRGFDDFENHPQKFTSNNTENREDFIDTTPIETPKQIEQSPAELLNDEFGKMTSDFSENQEQSNQCETNIMDIEAVGNTNLEQAIEAHNETTEIEIAAPSQTKMKKIKNIFETVKAEILKIFEDVDDQNLNDE